MRSGMGRAPVPVPRTPTRSVLNDGDRAILASGFELNGSFGRGEDRVVAAEAGSLARPEAGAPLADDDLAACHLLAGEDLDPEHLRVGVATVAAGPKAFLMSHLRPPLWQRVFWRPLSSEPLFSRRRPSSALSPRAWSARSDGRPGGGSPSSACI